MTDKEYYGLIQPYEDAMKLLLTRLEVLNHSIYKTKTGRTIIMSDIHFRHILGDCSVFMVPDRK